MCTLNTKEPENVAELTKKNMELDEIVEWPQLIK